MTEDEHEKWFLAYFEKFNEMPPLLYMQGSSDEKQIEMMKMAIERGRPLEQEDFGYPPGVDI